MYIQRGSNASWNSIIDTMGLLTTSFQEVSCVRSIPLQFDVTQIMPHNARNHDDWQCPSGFHLPVNGLSCVDGGIVGECVPATDGCVPGAHCDPVRDDRCPGQCPDCSLTCGVIICSDDGQWPSPLCFVAHSAVLLEVTPLVYTHTAVRALLHHVFGEEASFDCTLNTTLHNTSLNLQFFLTPSASSVLQRIADFFDAHPGTTTRVLLDSSPSSLSTPVSMFTNVHSGYVVLVVVFFVLAVSWVLWPRRWSRPILDKGDEFLILVCSAGIGVYWVLSCTHHSRGVLVLCQTILAVFVGMLLLHDV